MMKTTFSTLIIVLVISCAHGSEIDIIRKKLRHHGECYIEEMHKNGTFEYLLYLTEYGNEEAILFSPILYKYSDAASAEAIKISLGRALLKNTEAVIGLIPEHFQIEDICKVPFIEAPDDIESIHISQALLNLKKLIPDSEGDEISRRECLKVFERLKEIRTEPRNQR